MTIDVGSRDDEIGILARNFNDMSRRLKDLYQNLESKVSQRTKDLEQANRALLAAIGRAEAMARKAEEGTMAKSQFLASMSHEMRTPMNAVLGMGEILDSTDLDDEQRRCVSVLLESGKALLDLIDDILDLSKIEAGEMTFENRPFHLENSVGKAFRIVSHAAHQKGLDLEYAIAPDVPDELVGDATRLQQILLNLLGNGVKFTDRGYVLLEISLGDERPDGSRFLNFCVRDTGIGIMADKLGTIFEKFTQADSSASRRHGGTGLGLAICQILCEKTRRRNTNRKRTRQGMQSLFLPALCPATSGPLPAPRPWPKKRILLIDGRDYAEASLGARLRRAGAQVTIAKKHGESPAGGQSRTMTFSCSTLRQQKATR